MKLTVFSFAAFVAAVPTLLSPKWYNEQYRFNPEAFKIASVRTGPANWPLTANNAPVVPKPPYAFDLHASIEKGSFLIKRAAKEGNALIVFPELWFPGHFSKFYNKTGQTMADYWDNNLIVGSPEWDLIVTAVKEAGIYASIGFAERDGNSSYMGQALLSPEGDILIQRRKVRPSGSERNFFSDGEQRKDLVVAQTPYGRIGMLNCYENFHPYAWSLWAQGEDIHIASFPWQTDYGQLVGEPGSNGSNGTRVVDWFEQMEVNGAAARYYAINGGSNVIFTAVGHAESFNTTGQTIASLDATADEEKSPFLITTLNTTAFRNAPIKEGESSWGVLHETWEAWSESAPKIHGTFEQKKANNVPDMITATRG